MSRTEILNRIRELLAKNDFQGASMTVLDEGVRLEEDTWYVPVQPSFDPKNTSQYYEALASIEADLLVDESVTVLLIPTDPEQRQTA